MISKRVLDFCVVVISAMSFVIACAATVSTVVQTCDSVRQNKIANDSSLGFDVDMDERDYKLGFSLRNVGPGKVHINGTAYFVDKKRVPGIEGAFEAAKLDSGRLRVVDLRDNWMGPGEEVPLFRYTTRRTEDAENVAATFIEDHLAVAVDYCTVGGRCEVKCSEKGLCGPDAT